MPMATAAILAALDAVVRPEDQPSRWRPDGVVALLVAAAAYPRTLPLNYRSHWALKAVSYWTDRRDLDAVSLSLLLEKLDQFDTRELSVAYLHTDGVIAAAFGRFPYQADHGYLARAGCPMLCDAALPEENTLLGDETSGHPGGSLRSGGVFEHCTVEVLSTANGKCTGYSFFRRCPECGLMHFHGHAVKRENTRTANQPQTVAYYLYPDFDSVGGYFSISSKTLIATKDLLQYQDLITKANSNADATDFLNNLATMSRLVGDNTPVFTEKALIDGWYAFSAAQWLRDISNPMRSMIRRGLQEEPDLCRLAEVYPGDENFAMTDLWRLMNTMTRDEYLEEHTLTTFDNALREWAKHQCRGCPGGSCSSTLTADGNLKLRRAVCKFCWRKPSQGSRFCALGKLGHQVQIAADSTNVDIPEGDALAAAADAGGMPACFKPATALNAAELVERDVIQNEAASAVEDLNDPEDADNTFIGAILKEARGSDIDGLTGNTQYVLVKYAASEHVSWIKLNPEKNKEAEAERLKYLPQAVSNAWKATARDRIMYVCDDLPSHAQGESVEFSQFDFDKDDTSVQAEKNAAALSCNTDKDKTETNTKSFGWFCSVYNCGICFCARELYRSEGKHAVAVFFATMLLTLVHAGVNVPMYIAYDDACHLVQRCLSLCGVHWIFAALVTMVVVVDKFHFSNHKDTWCVRCLNPHRYKQLDDNNTESCEQFFRWFNRFKEIVFNKPGGRYRFYILRLIDLKNCKQVTKMRRPRGAFNLGPRKEPYTDARKKRLSEHEAAKKAVASHADDLPDAFRDMVHFHPLVIKNNFGALRSPGGILAAAAERQERQTTSERQKVQRDLRDFYVANAPPG